MNHKLFRILRQEGGWVSRLYLAGGFSCWTIAKDCLDTVPDGIYPLKIITSPSHGLGTIWICREIEKFLSGVSYVDCVHHQLIHAGNTVSSSLSCECVGRELNTNGVDFISNSVDTLNIIKSIIKDGDTLEIKTLGN